MKKTLILFILAYLLLGIFYIRFSPVSPEEGNYVYGSLLASSGSVPVSGFQADLSWTWYYAFGSVLRLFDGGIFLARSLSWFCGLLVIWLLVRMGRELSGDTGALVAAGCFIFNPFVLTLLATAFPLALELLLLTGIIYLLVRYPDSSRMTILAGALAALAGFMDLPNTCLLAILFIGIIKYSSRKNVQWLAGASVVASLGIYWYIRGHLDGWGAMTTGGWLPRVLYYNVLGTVFSRFDFLSNTARSAGALLVLLALVLPSAIREKNRRLAGIMIYGAGIFLFQFLKQPPNYFYDLLWVPFAAIAIGWGYNYGVKKEPGLRKLYLSAVIVIMVMGALTQRDRLPFIGVKADKSCLQDIRSAAALIKERTKPDDLVLSFDAGVAVEARRKLINNAICGWKSFFPGISDEQAARSHVSNTRQLVQLIRERKPAAIFITDPRYFQVNPEETREIDMALVQNYEPVARYQDFNSQGKAYLAIPRKNK